MWWSVAAVLVILIACGVWVAVQAFRAKADLEASLPLVATIQSQMAAGDAKAATATTAALEKRVRSARDESSGFLWRAAEVIPLLGPNLSAVREVSSAVSDVTDRSIKPLVALTGKLGLSSFKPVHGAIPLQPLVAAEPTVTAANAALQSNLADVRAIDTSGTMSIVKDAVGRLRGALEKAGIATEAAARAVQLLPDMLGRNGPRNYLLIVQNNAEARSTGGIAGALALLHAQDGAITLVRQASSTDFRRYTNPVLPLPTATRELYGDRTGEYIQDVTLTPQFPLSAAIAREMWKKQFGTEVDGVLSIDPIALSYLLKATGPIALPTGDQLTSGNAVQLLLSEAYARYSDPNRQNAFFAAAAAAVFAKVANGDVDPTAMISALARAGDERRVLVWSARDTEQSSLASTTLAGGLPVSSPTQQRFGVYLNDATGAKMDYYLHATVDLGSAQCRADERRNYVVRVTLRSSAPADAATALPRYVTGGGVFGVPIGETDTTVAVYAPPGAVLLGAVHDGKNVAVQRVTDQHHAVAHLLVKLKPGQSAMYEFQFVGAAPRDATKHSDAVSAQTTPGVNTTEVATLPFRCSDVLK